MHDQRIQDADTWLSPNRCQRSKPFEKIILCENNSKIADACETRVMKTPAGARCIVFGVTATNEFTMQLP